MIKFFRKIRQQLLSENKFSKYLIYAIGEIVLVVFGILIALQINNWNQGKLKVEKEIEILKSFESQFEQDLNQFDESLTVYGGAKNSVEIILNHLENNLPYSDSLKLHFFKSTRFYGSSDLDNNVFETVQSLGIDIISNKEIRREIVRLYDDSDGFVEGSENLYKEFLFDASRNIFNTRFDEFWNDDLGRQSEMVPLDFENLKRDREYLYFLKTQRNHIGWLLERPVKLTKSVMIELKEDLRTEIERLENK